jgi:hypothetical protein
VFLGGVINAMIIRACADFWLSAYNYSVEHQLPINQQLQIIPSFIISFAIVFSIPILFSFVFTRTHPEKRIVPPLGIQLISVSLLLFFVYNQTTIDFQMIYSISFAAVLMGLYQDAVVSRALGRTATTENIIQWSWKIPTNVNRVKDIMLSNRFRRLNNLALITKPKGETIRLRTRAKRGNILILELREDKVNEETIVNLAFYHLQAYGLKPIKEMDDSYLWAMGRIGALKKTLNLLLSVQITDGDEDSADSLVAYVLDDMTGALSRFQEMATTRKVAIILAIIFIAVAIGLFATDRIDWGLGALGIGVLLITDVVLRE